MLCIKRVFALSDTWADSKHELIRFKKILDSEQPTKAPAVQKPTEENLENFKAIELLEGKEDRSIKMAPIVKIRNNLYYTVVGCFKAGFSLDFILTECQLLKRLVSDLQLDSLNDYIFQHLIMCL